MAERPCFSGVLDGSAHDGLWQWAQRQYGLKGSWQTLWLNGLPLGRLNPQWGAQLKKDWPDAVGEDSDGLHLAGESWTTLGLSLQSTACGWRDAGVLRGWRGEYFDVCDEAGRPLFALERAAFRPFGLLSRAIHLNGLTCRGGWRFWIGRRRAKKKRGWARFCPTDCGGKAAYTACAPYRAACTTKSCIFSMSCCRPTSLRKTKTAKWPDSS